MSDVTTIRVATAIAAVVLAVALVPQPATARGAACGSCRVAPLGPCRRVDRFTVLCPRKRVCETRRHCR